MRGADALCLLDPVQDRLEGRAVCLCGYQPFLEEVDLQRAEWSRVDSDPALHTLVCGNEPVTMPFIGTLVRSPEEAEDFRLWLGIEFSDDGRRSSLTEVDAETGCQRSLQPACRSLAVLWSGDQHVSFYGGPEAQERFMAAFSRWEKEGRPGRRALRVGLAWGETPSSMKPGTARQGANEACNVWFESPGDPEPHCCP